MDGNFHLSCCVKIFWGLSFPQSLTHKYCVSTVLGSPQDNTTGQGPPCSAVTELDCPTHGREGQQRPVPMFFQSAAPVLGRVHHGSDHDHLLVVAPVGHSSDVTRMGTRQSCGLMQRSATPDMKFDIVQVHSKLPRTVQVSLRLIRRCIF